MISYFHRLTLLSFIEYLYLLQTCSDPETWHPLRPTCQHGRPAPLPGPNVLGPHRDDHHTPVDVRRSRTVGGNPTPRNERMDLSRSQLPARPLRAFAAAALLVMGASACTPVEQDGATTTPPTLPAFTTTTPSSATPSPAAAPGDYSDLLLTAADLTNADDTFVERNRKGAPDGHPGATAFFVNEPDTRAISNTVLIYPDETTATAALQQATSTTKVTGEPQLVGVGQDGIVIRGSRPDEGKAVTLLLFTEGPALVRLEFQSADGDVTTDEFVTAIGKMQQIALRVGLPTQRGTG